MESTSHLRHLIRSLLIEVSLTEALEIKNIKVGDWVWYKTRDDKRAYQVKIDKIIDDSKNPGIKGDGRIKFTIGQGAPMTIGLYRFSTSPPSGVKISHTKEGLASRAATFALARKTGKNLKELGWSTTWLSLKNEKYARHPLLDRSEMVTAWLERDPKKLKGYDDSSKGWYKWYRATEKVKGSGFGPTTAVKWISNPPDPKVESKPEEPSGGPSDESEKVWSDVPVRLKNDKKWEYIHRTDKGPEAGYTVWWTRKIGTDKWISLPDDGESAKRLNRAEDAGWITKAP